MGGRIGAPVVVGAQELVEERRRDPRLEHQPAAKVGACHFPILCGRLVAFRTRVQVGRVVIRKVPMGFTDHSVACTVRHPGDRRGGRDQPTQRESHG